MASLQEIFIDFMKAHKAYLLFLFLMVLGCLGYGVFSHSLIEGMYEGRSLAILNDLIQYQHKHSLEHYLELADYLFIRILFVLFSLGSFLYLLYLLVFSVGKVSLFWLLLFFTTVCILLYALNPNHRVYSYHGFYRVGIAYQILNGFIPPRDFLFAGEVLRAPWGYPFLIACITRIFRISPFYSCAVINLISLNLVCCLLYRISQFLLRDSRANVFSVLISIFGITIVFPHLQWFLTQHTGLYLECRATPAFNKFLGVAGDPVGLVFYCLFLYSILRFYTMKPIGGTIFTIFVSFLGCGFFYPPMYPAMLATVALLCVVTPVFQKRHYPGLPYRKLMFLTAGSLLSLLPLIPYGMTISSGVKGGTSIGTISAMASNTLNYAMVSLPILTVIYLHKFHWRGRLEGNALFILVIFILTSVFCYIFIHFPTHGEYKYLLLSLMCTGVLGGISFDFMRRHSNRFFVFFVLVLFFVPCAEWIYDSLLFYAGYPIRYYEKGPTIHSLDQEEEELFTWIRQHTPSDSVFIDTELTIPIYAQRCLFIGIDKEGHRALGYWAKIDVLLQDRHGHDSAEIEKRKNIVHTLCNQADAATEEEIESLLRGYKHVYIVTREHTNLNSFKQIHFELIFRSSRNQYKIYQYTHCGFSQISLRCVAGLR